MDNFVRYATMYCNRDQALLNAVIVASELNAMKEVVSDEISDDKILELLSANYEGRINDMLRADRVLSAVENVLTWSRKRTNMKARCLKWIVWEDTTIVRHRKKTKTGDVIEYPIRRRVGGLLFDVQHIRKILFRSL